MDKKKEDYIILAKQKKRKQSPASYQKRSYRSLVESDGLCSFQVKVRETDLHVLANTDLKNEAIHFVIQYRIQLESYIFRRPQFLTSLTPIAFDITAPVIVKDMLAAALAAGVGPMAAVAGAMAEYVGRDLLDSFASEVMVENGGDIFLKKAGCCRVAIFAGESPLSNKIGLQIYPADMPLGICTSSATIGHSLSFGNADAVTVVAPSVSLADAVATRIANETISGRTIAETLRLAESIEGITGVVVVRGEELGAWGRVELVQI